MSFRIVCIRISSFIVGQSGNVNLESFAERRHRSGSVFDMLKRQVIISQFRHFTRNDIDFVFIDNHLLSHVSHSLISHQKYRDPVLFGQVKCPYCEIEKFLYACRGQCYRFIITMRSPACLHHVSLSAHCWLGC